MFNHKFLTCSPLTAICGTCWNKWVSPSSAGSGRAVLVHLSMGMWKLLTIDYSSMFLFRRGRWWFMGTTLRELCPWDATCESCGKEMTYMNFVRKEGNLGREGSEEELGSPFPEYPPALLESRNCYSSSQCHPFCFRRRKQQMSQQSSTLNFLSILMNM